MRHPRLASTLALVSLLPALTSRAAVITSSASGDWSTGGNWIGGVAPYVGGSVGGPGTDSAIINGHTMTISGAYPNGDFDIKGGQSVTINAGGTVNDTHAGGTWNRIGDAGSAGTLNINQGTYIIGTGGTGPLHAGMAGGTAVINVGNGSGSADAVLNTNNRTVNLSHNQGGIGVATMNIASDGLWLLGGSNPGVHIGNDGAATLNMTGGTISGTAVGSGTDGFSFAQNATGNGTLLMSNGSQINLTAGDMQFGLRGVFNGTMGGTSQINHSAASSWMRVGAENLSTGNLTLNDNAQLNSTNGGTGQNVTIGQNGSGTVTLNNSSQLNVPGKNLRVGSAATGVGVLNINNSAVATVGGGQFRVGETAGARGSILMSGGTFNLNTTVAETYIGESGAGTLSLSGDARFNVNNAGSSFQFGRNSTGAGTLDISGGRFHSERPIVFSEGGSARVTQTGGIVSSGGSGWISIGHNGTAGTATYSISGGALNGGSLLTIGENGARGVLNQTGGVVSIPATSDGLRMSYNQSGGVGGGTYNLEGGTFRLWSANLKFQATSGANGTFNWGGGVIAPYQGGFNKNNGTTDYTVPVVPSGPQVKLGSTITWNGNLTSGYNGQNSRIDLGDLYLSNGLRFDQVSITNGQLNLSSANDTLELNFNPYFLRPFSNGASDYGSLPLIVAGTGGSITGSFDTYVGVMTDSVGFSQYTGAFTGVANLPVNTWYVESTGSQILFHYKVAFAVPEPGTLGLGVVGVLMMRLARRRAR